MRAERHQGIREQLADYATLRSLGQDATTTYPRLAAHLARCQACRRDLTALLGALEWTCDLTRPAVTTPPVPDLSFLPTPRDQPPRSPRSWMIDALGRLVITFSAALLQSWRSPALASAMRGGTRYRYTPEDGGPPGLAVVVEITAEGADRQRGRIRIAVDHLCRDPLDQAGTVIELALDDARWRGETDETSEVSFTDLPLAALDRLRIAITTQP